MTAEFTRRGFAQKMGQTPDGLCSRIDGPPPGGGQFHFLRKATRRSFTMLEFVRRHFVRIFVGVALFLIGYAATTALLIRSLLLPYQRELQIARQIDTVGGKVTTSYYGPLWILIPDSGWDKVPFFDRIDSIRFAGRNQAIPPDILAEIGTLDRLGWLDLDGTDVSDAGLEHLKRLKSIYSLDLSGTQISDVGLEHLQGLTSLKSLTLSATNVTDTGLEHLKHLTGLIRLWLNETQITDAGLNHLNGVGNLDLSRTQITDTGLRQLGSQTSLVRLILSGTKITDEGVAFLNQLTNLNTLDLTETQVTDIGLEHFKRMTNLNRLYLGNTQTTRDGREMLRKMLPSCNIEPNP